jgi:hypothetical protein
MCSARNGVAMKYARLDSSLLFVQYLNWVKSVFIFQNVCDT